MVLSKGHEALEVSAVPSSIILVSSTAELLAALKTANGGEEILLQGGSYDNVNLRSKDGVAFNYAAPVTIRSADPANPALIHDMNLNHVSNLTFNDITFDYQFKVGDPLSETPFEILYSQNITIRASTFLGDDAVSGNLQNDGFPTGIGLYVVGSSGITVENTEFSTWMRGALFTKSNNLVLRDNEIHDDRSEGFNFAQVQNVLIEGNYFHDFRGSITSGDHRDMIQFWSGKTNAPSTDITIRSNQFDVGDGTWTQTIFMRNEAVDVYGAGKEMYYQNVLIEQNVIVAQHHHGITLGQTNGLTIRDNTVLREEAGQGNGSVWTPKINVVSASTDVHILDNVTGGITGYSVQSDWQVSGNIIVQDQDPQSANYYDALFVNPVPGDRGDLANIQALPNSVIAQSGIGADMLTQNLATGDTTAGSGSGEGGTPLVSALTLSDYFDDAGFDGYRMSVDIQNSGLASKLCGTDASVDTVTGELHLDGTGGYANLGRLTAYEHSSAIAMSIEYTRDQADGSAVRLMWNHMKMGLELVGEDLRLRLGTADEGFKLFTVKDVGLNDTDTHRIILAMDEAADVFDLIIDSELVMECSNVDLAFSGAGGREWGWWIGAAVGRALDGTIHDFQLDDLPGGMDSFQMGLPFCPPDFVGDYIG